MKHIAHYVLVSLMLNYVSHEANAHERKRFWKDQIEKNKENSEDNNKKKQVL